MLITLPAPQVATINNILLLATKKYKKQDYHGAIELYTQAIQLDPTNALTFCCRGVTYYQLVDRHKAMVDYDKAIDLAPNLAITYYRRGFLYYLAKKYLSALSDYNKSIELDHNFALAYSNWNYIYRELYGEQEIIMNLQFAVKSFKQKGNAKKYQITMKLVAESIEGDSWGAGML
jgi:tetratricopeptide (TPR) repeat protein